MVCEKVVTEEAPRRFLGAGCFLFLCLGAGHTGVFTLKLIVLRTDDVCIFLSVMFPQISVAKIFLGRFYKTLTLLGWVALPKRSG